MAQTSPNDIAKKSVCTSIEQASTIDIYSKPECTFTKKAFQDCLSINADTRIYREITKIFLLDLIIG